MLVKRISKQTLSQNEMLDRKVLCETCSELVSLAAEYKQGCRNPDHIICLEMCAKYCHVTCFCAATNNLDHGMLRKLHQVCKWCSEVCLNNIAMNTNKACCRRFHECLTHLAEVSQDEPTFRGSFQYIDEDHVHAVGRACRKMYQAGMVQKPLALLENRFSSDKLAIFEACVKMCGCLSFMVDNACQHIDNNMLDSCIRMCNSCVQNDCCAEEARVCISACSLCAQQAQLPAPGGKTCQLHRNGPDIALASIVEQLLR